MAEQSTAQQEDQRLVEIVLANVGTVICFRSGSPADERRLLPLFDPYLSTGDIAHLPSYQFYIRIAALQYQPPMLASTIVSSNVGTLFSENEVIKRSRQHHAVRYGLNNKATDKLAERRVQTLEQLKSIKADRL